MVSEAPEPPVVRTTLGAEVVLTTCPTPVLLKGKGAVPTLVLADPVATPTLAVEVSVPTPPGPTGTPEDGETRGTAVVPVAPTSVPVAPVPEGRPEGGERPGTVVVVPSTCAVEGLGDP